MPSEHPMQGDKKRLMNLLQEQERRRDLTRLHEPPERQYLQVGVYALSPCPHGGFWIYHESGEGGQFSAESLEALIARFYKDNF